MKSPAVTHRTMQGRRRGTGARLTPWLVAFAVALAGCGGGSGDDDDDDDDGNSLGGSGGSSGAAGSSGRGGGSGSGGGGAVPGLGDLGGDPAPEAEWTFFVYGHGDHNLSNSLLADLQEMARADLGSGAVNVLALTDWDASQAIAGSDPPEAFPEGIQLFRIPGGGADIELVAEGPEASLDDPAVLTEVVGAVFAGFPARRRAVVLWDHGGAWSGGFGSDTQNGTVASPTAMPAEAVPAALAQGLEAAGIDASPALDLIAFDTCLMAGAEIVYPFRELAAVYTANAEIDYGAGWDYTATLTYLARNPTVGAAELAAAEVEHWDDHHAGASANDALLRSHVALDLTGVEALAEATRARGDAVAGSTSFEMIELGRSSFLALPPYASQFENAASSIPGLRDMGQFLDSLAASGSDAEVADAAAGARDALEALVIARSEGSLRASSQQAGIHLELSVASQLSGTHLDSYGERASAWAGASGWRGVLAALAGAADATPPSFLRGVLNAEGATAAAPPILELSTIDPDTVKGSIYLGTALDAETIAFLGLVGTGIVEPETDYTFEWDGSVTTFPDGQPAMVDLWLEVGSASAEPVLMVPGVLTVANDELIANLVFVGSEGAATAAVVSLGEVASTLTLSEIVGAYPDATFTPLYFGVSTVSGESGLIAGYPIGLPSDGALRFGTDYAGAGTYLYLTSISDVWGNSSTEADAFELLEPLGP